MNKITVFRPEGGSQEFDIDKRTVYTHEVSGQHDISAVIVSDEPIDIREEDYIIFRDESYYVNQPPSYVKSAKKTYTYTVNFEHVIYKTYHKILMHLGRADFSYFGDARAQLQLVVDNLNALDSGWVVGNVDQTEERNVQYLNGEKGYSCRTAITLIGEEFGLELSYTGKTLNLTKTAGINTGISFEYGRGDGLYELERLTPDNYMNVNRLYPFGGKTNIPFDYRGGSNRLRIDSGYIDRQREPYEPIREDSLFFDDIFPERTSTITEVNDIEVLTDSTMDFDLNDHLIDGVVAKMVFKSGYLQGNEFEIEEYDNDTRTFTIIPNTDENGYTLPNETIHAEVGDSYTLIGISLPQSYIDDAELRLFAAAEEALSQPQTLPYAVTIDEKFMRDNGIVLNAGDRIRIKDHALMIDQDIRTFSVSFPIVSEGEITAEISDHILYTKIDRVIHQVGRQDDVVARNEVNSAQAARDAASRFRRMQELVFDPDGYFDPSNIRPNSIETGMVSVGVKSQNFGLNGVTFSTNHLGNPDRLVISAGKLIHYEIEIEGVGFVWQMSSANFTGLDPAKSYFVYAKCSKSSLNGTWEISEIPVFSEDPTTPDFYNFNVGILFEVQSGRRGFEFTKGMTFIVGDNITTGRVKDITGNNYFDLNTGQFKLGNTIRGIDWNVSNSGYLTIFGGIVASPSGAIDYIPVFRGDWSPVIAYYKGDTVKWTDGNTYKYINESVEGATNIPPPNPSYWRVSTEKGADGNYTEYRFQKNGSSTTPPPVQADDPNPSGWTIQQPTISVGEYLWAITTIKKGDGSLVQNWSTPFRMSGTRGEDGERGASLVFRGNYSSLAVYYGNPTRVDAVKYGAMFYVARSDAPSGSFDGVLPTDGDYWNEFGAVFESVATSLLLAELAYITNLGVRFLQTDIEGRKRVQIDGVENNFSLYVNDGDPSLPPNPLLDRKILEADDDSTPDFHNVYYFQIEYNPASITDDMLTIDRHNDYSQFNLNSIDSRTGNSADFSTGFPAGYSYYKIDVSDTYPVMRFYFYKMVAGLGVSHNLDSIVSNSYGEWGADVKNIRSSGSVSQKYVKSSELPRVDEVSDSRAMVRPWDHHIIIDSVSRIVLPSLRGDYGDPTDFSGDLPGLMLGRELVFYNQMGTEVVLEARGSIWSFDLITTFSRDSTTVRSNFGVPPRGIVKVVLLNKDYNVEPPINEFDMGEYVWAVKEYNIMPSGI